MHDPFLMGIVHGACQNLEQGRGIACLLRRACELAVQVAALRKFKGKVGELAKHADFVDLDDVLVLEAGDVVTTGTPPGVALGMKPPVWLKAGDVMKLSIAGLGEQQQKVTPFRE